MAGFNEKFQQCLESTLASFKHGISPAVVAELESLKPVLGNLTQDDACLRAWKKLEKVYFFQCYTLCCKSDKQINNK
jgi:hypothetical protein